MSPLIMELKKTTIEELKKIISKDYGADISNEQANNLGSSLLHLTNLSIITLARADERSSSSQARYNISKDS
jgi:hypothetical protein